MRTKITYDPIFLLHDPGEHHPEAPWRLSGISNVLITLSPNTSLVKYDPTDDYEFLYSVHDPTYVESVQKLAGLNSQIDHETVLSPESVKASVHAARSCANLVTDVYLTDSCNGFAIVRPPGHHAGRKMGGGYCIFNNAAVAAQKAIALGAGRVLIVDWDAHRGNGTQDIFSGRDDVSVFSIHQSCLFPSSELDTNAWGAKLSVPVPPQSGTRLYLDVFKNILLPYAELFKPEFIVVSCGFDSHADDPMSDLKVTTEGFGKLTELLCSIANRHCRGKMLFVLEGGYDCNSLNDSLSACLQVLSKAEDY